MDPPVKRQRLVWVFWHDACSDSSRTHIDELDKVHLARNWNLGWIIHENSERILLAHGTCSSGEIDHFSIPKNCIIEMHSVYGKQRKPKVVKPENITEVGDERSVG